MSRNNKANLFSSKIVHVTRERKVPQKSSNLPRRSGTGLKKVKSSMFFTGHTLAHRFCYVTNPCIPIRIEISLWNEPAPARAAFVVKLCPRNLPFSEAEEPNAEATSTDKKSSRACSTIPLFDYSNGSSRRYDRSNSLPFEKKKKKRKQSIVQ